MEKLILKRRDADRAIGTLNDILREPYSVIVRDAAVHRFEYTFEALWKFFQEYLQKQEGIVANSPKAVFRELLAVGLLTEEETAAFLEMTDRRNDTAHTYKEAVAQAIYSRLSGYLILMKSLLVKVK
jgi:nucleotidyltransferase substrate binding protein (TIGR01987 family)